MSGEIQLLPFQVRASQQIVNRYLKLVEDPRLLLDADTGGSAYALTNLGLYCGRGARQLEMRPHSTSGILAPRVHARAPAHVGR